LTSTLNGVDECGVQIVETPIDRQPARLCAELRSKPDASHSVEAHRERVARGLGHPMMKLEIRICEGVGIPRPAGQAALIEGET
jgi:hypothetical protein